MRSAVQRTDAGPAIACPPAPARTAKARIEKSLWRASGKVKARNFFEQMGGVLFWNPQTHTVTVCVNDMVLEMRIGSRLARVNGHEMEMQSAPYLANNRTVFEASTYTQACNLMESLRTVSKADLH
jgi:hypothetical protein